jgi:hypothetical protein
MDKIMVLSVLTSLTAFVVIGLAAAFDYIDHLESGSRAPLSYEQDPNRTYPDACDVQVDDMARTIIEFNGCAGHNETACLMADHYHSLKLVRDAIRAQHTLGVRISVDVVLRLLREGLHVVTFAQRMDDHWVEFRKGCVRYDARARRNPRIEHVYAFTNRINNERTLVMNAVLCGQALDTEL